MTRATIVRTRWRGRRKWTGRIVLRAALALPVDFIALAPIRARPLPIFSKSGPRQIRDDARGTGNTAQPDFGNQLLHGRRKTID